MNNSYGPKTDAGDRLDAMKYREQGEDFRECCNRNAWAMADNGNHYNAFREIILHMRFLTAGRVRRAMGAATRVTPYNCFVSGTIADTYVGDGIGDATSIMGRCVEAASTMRLGGGIGYDFSTLRPRNDAVLGVASNSSGPTSFMRIFNEVCLVTSSSGHRRGAQMGVLRVDHPDIEEFIRSKQNTTELTGFNVSVAITDEFMKCVEEGTSFSLRFNDKHYRYIDARALWEKIMRSTYDYAEPGVLFIDRINQMNNLYYCETLSATNPCGEQPLPPYGACLLGSINLTAYVHPHHRWGFEFNYEMLRADIPHIVRAMDNVIDRAIYPLEEQRREAQDKRRMGIGVTGLANAGEALKLPYGSPEFIAFMEGVLNLIKNECYAASARLAQEKGPFRLYQASLYNEGRFIKTLDDDVQDLIHKYGIRNSHLTSIAPTGTISMLADNVSSGLEPVFSYMLQRPINTPNGPAIETLEDYGHKFFNVKGKLSSDVTPAEHVAVLCAAQRHVDSAISKTCNVPTDIDWNAFKDVYWMAYKGGAKGCTTYRKGGKREGLLTEQPAQTIIEGAACELQPDGSRSCE